MTLLIRLALALAVALPASGAFALTPDETARVLAGLETSVFAEDEKKRELIEDFAAEATDEWAKWEKRMGEKISAWAASELPQKPGATIYYPFAGPDLPTVQKLYPDASRYILVALQKGGRVPDISSYSPSHFRWFMNVYKRGWGGFAYRGFFHTDHMKRDMEGDDAVVEGITPILMAFAVRLGYDLVDIAPIRVAEGTPDLEVIPDARDERATWDSVRLTLERRADKKRVLVDYVFLDLSDGYLKKNEAARAWVTAVSAHPVVTKAASHLMQKSFFSVVKDAILHGAPSVFQDETGVEYDELKKHFACKLYGNFTRANKLWTDGAQRSLRKAYERRDDVSPLPFQIGYKKESGSSVQFCVRTK